MDPNTTYDYTAKVLEVVDGDTVKVSVRLRRSRAIPGDLGFHVYIEDGWICVHESLRLVGINAPEKYTPEGKVAKAWLQAELPVDLLIDCKTILDKTEKYGRFLATLTVPKHAQTVNDELVAAHQALPWDGRGPRPVSPAGTLPGSAG